MSREENTFLVEEAVCDFKAQKKSNKLVKELWTIYSS